MRYFVVLRNSSKECHSEEIAIFSRSRKWVKITVSVSIGSLEKMLIVYIPTFFQNLKNRT